MSRLEWLLFGLFAVVLIDVIQGLLTDPRTWLISVAISTAIFLPVFIARRRR